jgi:hypothetical protein
MRRTARHLSTEHRNVNDRNLLPELIWGMTGWEIRTRLRHLTYLSFTFRQNIRLYVEDTTSTYKG